MEHLDWMWDGCEAGEGAKCDPAAAFFFFSFPTLFPKDSGQSCSRTDMKCGDLVIWSLDVIVST